MDGGIYARSFFSTGLTTFAQTGTAMDGFLCSASVLDWPNLAGWIWRWTRWGPGGVGGKNF